MAPQAIERSRFNAGVDVEWLERTIAARGELQNSGPFERGQDRSVEFGRNAARFGEHARAVLRERAVRLDVLAELGLDAPAAIVSSYVSSSPTQVESASMSGRLRVVPIARSGFASPLPAELLGGDSEGCDSVGRSLAPILRAELALD